MILFPFIVTQESFKDRHFSTAINQQIIDTIFLFGLRFYLLINVFGSFWPEQKTCHLAWIDVYSQFNNSAYDKAFSKFAFHCFLIKVSWRICLTVGGMYGVKSLLAPHNIFGGGRSIWW